jgi:hypothetical protein
MWEDSSTPAQDLLFGMKPYGGGTQQKNWSPQLLTTGGRYRRWVEISQEGHWAGNSSVAL